LPTPTTKRVPPARPARTPKAEPTPRLMKIGRPVLTVIGFLMIVFALFWIPLNLGRGQSIYAGVAMVAIGVTLTVAAQFRRLYVWSESVTVLDDVDDAPVVAHADQAPPARRDKPAPKQRRGQDDPEFPTLKPSWSLGPEFRYIVLYGRHLAAEYPQWLADMDTFWNTIDWDSDDTDSDYREVIEFLYGLARALPTWDESATRDQMMAGTVARDNAFAFVAELESYHPLIAATAILMLVRGDSKVTAEDFDQALEPWTDLGLSYRLGDMVFAWKGNEYKATEVESRTAPQQAPGVQHTTRVTDPADGAVPPPPVDFPEPAAAPAPQPVAPQPAPAEPVRHVEPERDDVPDPTAEQIVHAARLIISSQLGSAPMIQRKLRVGLTLASKIMYRLNYYGVVGEPNSAGPNRQVMVGEEELDDMIDFITEQEAERQNG
jgi:Ftsk gamma domain